jgi:enoyl-[acyl-carrier protein] reductase II
MKNHFYTQVEKAYAEGANVEELKTLLGRGRAKKGMFEGDIVEGELEIGQIAGLFDEIIPAKAIVDEIITSYRKALNEQNTEKYTF